MPSPIKSQYVSKEQLRNVESPLHYLYSIICFTWWKQELLMTNTQVSNTIISSTLFELTTQIYTFQKRINRCYPWLRTENNALCHTLSNSSLSTFPAMKSKVLFPVKIVHQCSSSCSIYLNLLQVIISLEKEYPWEKRL